MWDSPYQASRFWTDSTCAPAVAGADKQLNHFETLTLAPIDRRLVDLDLMTTDEIAWVDAYHANVRETLMPLVTEDTRTWLGAATAPLGSRES